MSFNNSFGVLKPVEWVRVKGRLDGRKYKVVCSNYATGRFEVGGGLQLPMEDYEECPPPREDVTSKLYVDSGYVKCGNDTVATLRCNGEYSV